MGRNTGFEAVHFVSFRDVRLVSFTSAFSAGRRNADIFTEDGNRFA
jgi:hypothetical protein